MELFIIFGVPGAIVAYVIYTRHRERMEAIKRGVHAYRIPSPPRAGSLALAFGLLIAALGLALLLAGIGIWDRVDHDLVTAGLILLFGGSALLLYWRITAEDRNKSRELYEKRLDIYLRDLPKHAQTAAESGPTPAESGTGPAESAMQAGES